MSSLWENIFQRDAEKEDRHSLLKKLPVFKTLGRREIIAVEKISYRREYAADEVIFRQDDPGLGMYIVERGTVSIIAENTGQVLTELQEGDFFGEIALLNESPRSASAKAKTSCTLICIFQPDVLDLVQRNTRLGVKLLLALARIASQRLIRLSEEAEVLREEVALLRARLEHEPESLHGEKQTQSNPSSENGDRKR